jgi:glycosyltransferase involved in cell wall biosynthesis
MSDEPYRLLSVVVPVFNERNTVNEVVRRVKSVALPDGLEREIIVVDDGSQDGTDNVLDSIQDSTVRVERHGTNRGQGAAVRTGLRVSRGDIVLIHDADLEYDPDDIPAVLAPIMQKRAGVVLGTRFRSARAVMPLTDTLLDRAVSIVACALFNTTLTDVESGCKAFDAKLLRSVDIESDGFSFGPELIAKFLRLGASFVEVPVNYSSRRSGGKFAASDRLRAVMTLTRYRFGR